MYNEIQSYTVLKVGEGVVKEGLIYFIVEYVIGYFIFRGYVIWRRFHYCIIILLFHYYNISLLKKEKIKEYTKHTTVKHTYQTIYQHSSLLNNTIAAV